MFARKENLGSIFCQPSPHLNKIPTIFQTSLSSQQWQLYMICVSSYQPSFHVYSLFVVAVAKSRFAVEVPRRGF